MTQGTDTDIEEVYCTLLLQGSIITLPPRGPKVCSKSLSKKRFVDLIFPNNFSILLTLSRVSIKKSAIKLGICCFLWRLFKIWWICTKERWWALNVHPVQSKILFMSSKVNLAILTIYNTFMIHLVLPNNSLSMLSWVYIITKSKTICKLKP